MLDRSIRQRWMMRKNKNMMTRKPSVGNVDDGHLNWPLANCETRGVLTTQCRTIHQKPREIPGKYYSHVIACLSPWFIWHFIPKAAINTQNMLFYLYTRLPTKDNRNIRNSWDLLNRATSEYPVTLFTFLCENSSKNRVYWIWLRGSASYVIIIIITTDYIFRNNVIWEVHGVQQLSCYFVTTAAQAKRTVSLT